jgi:TatD DNase family protein
LETDSPYLAPPGPTNRRNDPTNLPRIAAILAPLWNLSGEELCWLTSVNAVGLFGLPTVDRSSTSAAFGRHGEPPTPRC